MAISSKWLKLIAALLLIGAFLFLRHITSAPKAPAIDLKTVQERGRFPFDFALPDLQGNTVRPSDLRGKVVLINIWATWCYPCRTEMPSMQALYQDYRDKGFEILAISIDVREKEAVIPFVEQYGLTFPVLLDPSNAVGERLLMRGIPTSYLLDKHGRIAGLEVGPKDWNSKKMRRLLEALLAEDGSRAPS